MIPTARRDRWNRSEQLAQGGAKYGIVFEKPKSLTDAPLHYCPGCTHGIIHRLVAEAIDELGIEGKTIGIAPVGCSVMAYDYFTCDMVRGCPRPRPGGGHRAASARSPDNIVFTYQGDGDLASIGTAETVHAATRGENITVIFVNNAIYGMTGGQMAPTTLPGQVTQTIALRPRSRNCAAIPSAGLRDALHAGRPAYIAQRVAVNSVKNIKQRQEGHSRRRLRIRSTGKGFSLVEVLSTCPTNWGMTPHEGSAMGRGKDDSLLSAGRI